MDNLPKSWVVLWVSIVFIICSALTVGWYFENWKIVSMAKQGYEEISPPGQRSTIWQKVR